jgi:Ca-activated chloride channel family protein
MRQEGGTALYDACHVGIERLKQCSNPKKVLLLISDGQENNSKHKLRDIMRALKETDVMVYSIVVADDSTILFSFMGDVLKEFAQVSGGATYYVGSGGLWSEAEITEMFDWIALNLRHQYLIGFRPKARDGKWRSIRVRIAQIVTRDKTKPDSKPKKLRLEARTRQGYYAIAQSADPGIRKN